MATEQREPFETEEACIFPTSFAQQRLWFLDKLEKDNFSYNVPLAVRLAGALDSAALLQSLTVIMQRHEVLRTTFTAIDGQPVQVISARQELPISVIDLQHLTSLDREQEANRLVQEEALRPFHLARGPLFRALLLLLEPQEHVLLLVIHHIVFDNWSLGIFLQEVVTLYTAYAQGKPIELPSLSLQYADFAFWQRKWLQGPHLERLIEYWKRQLEGAPPLTALPLDYPRPGKITGNGAVSTHVLPLDLVEQMKEAGQQEACTTFMVLVAALDVLIFSSTKQRDIVIGTDVSNRTRAEVEGLIGFFINQLVLRSRLSDELSFRELLRQVRATALEAYTHQELPFDKLVEALNPARDLSYTPLFQIKISPQIPLQQTFNLLGITMTTMRIEKRTSQVDLNIRVFENKDGLLLSAEYNSDLFHASTVEHLLWRFEYILRLGGAQLDSSLGTLISDLAKVDAHHQKLKGQQLQEMNRQRLHGMKRRAINLNS